MFLYQLKKIKKTLMNIKTMIFTQLINLNKWETMVETSRMRQLSAWSEKTLKLSLLLPKSKKTLLRIASKISKTQSLQVKMSRWLTITSKKKSKNSNQWINQLCFETPSLMNQINGSLDQVNSKITSKGLKQRQERSINVKPNELINIKVEHQSVR